MSNPGAYDRLLGSFGKFDRGANHPQTWPQFFRVHKTYLYPFTMQMKYVLTCYISTILTSQNARPSKHKRYVAYNKHLKGKLKLGQSHGQVVETSAPFSQCFTVRSSMPKGSRRRI
jgi:hypothetical protein